MDGAAARELFDRHASHYDRVNSVMSVGLDRHWREWAAHQAVWKPHASVLELMCGTGEISVSAAKLGGRVQAADVSPAMLRMTASRARREGAEIGTMMADVTKPEMLPDATFDSVVVSFGLRYIDDKVAFLESLRRNLNPEGRLVLLEFCRSRPGLVRTVASVYFFRLMPWIGAMLSGEPDLYEYLPGSVMTMGTAENIVRIVDASGFAETARRSFGFGLVLGLVARAED